MINLSSEDDLKMRQMHKYLMNKGFPYHSVSVIYQHGFSVIFSNGIRDLVTDKIKEHIASNGFDLTINNK